MNVLVVAAHPDDEVLGAGATIHSLARQGANVYACVVSMESVTREDGLLAKMLESHRTLGIKGAYYGDFECMRLKDADHHSIVMLIESAIRKSRPDVVITHHPADVHIDHQIVAECCLEAIRLPQRQIEDVPRIRGMLSMEVPSSTDWNADASKLRFVPNAYREVDADDIAAKMDALAVYDGVIRERPHPRSREAIESLAVVRGANFGVGLAEAFQQVFGEVI